MTRTILLLLALASLSCSSPTAPTQSSGVAVYRISGQARTASVTFTDPPGTNGPPTDVTVPWTRTVSQVNTGAFLQLRAQITDTRGGAIFVQIDKNGQLCQNATVAGFAAVATVGCVF